MSHKNPSWLDDELILCLDIYLHLQPQTPSEKLGEIQRLSKLLNMLADRLGIVRAENYRTPASVVMKMMNFRSMDSTYKGAGLKSVGTRDALIWKRYSNDPTLLSETVASIRNAINEGYILNSNEGDSDTGVVDAKEGRLLSKMHFVRERSSRLVRDKKRDFIKKHGKLFCEACGFNYTLVYGERGNNFIECHHVLPLHTYSSSKNTKTSELVMLCASCHRMIHVAQPWLTMMELKGMLNNQKKLPLITVP